MSSEQSRKSVDPVVAFLIILGYAGIGWAWWDAADRAGQVPAPSHMQVTASDTLAVRLGGRIEEMDAAGGYLRTLELERLGFVSRVGDFVMPEPDVLVAWADAGEPVADEGAGLYRCTLPDGPCKRFAPELNRDHGVFRMHWSEEQGLAVVTLVSNELWLLDRQGEVTARSAAVLDNANGVHGDGEHIWVADADNHRLVAFRTDGSRLRPAAELDGALAFWRRWPSGVVPADDGHWALVAGPMMRFPGLALLDRHGGTVREVSMPRGVEPDVMVPFGGGLLLGDMNGRALYRVSGDGDWLGHADLGITPMLEGYRQRHEPAVFQRNLFQWLFIGSALVIIAVLWWRRRQEQLETYNSPVAADAATTGTAGADTSRVEEALAQQEEYWLERPAALARHRWMAHGVTILMIGLMGKLAQGEDASPASMLLWLAMILLMVSFSLWMEQLARIRIGVCGRDILVRDWKGRVHRAGGAELALHSRGQYLRVGEVLLPVLDRSGVNSRQVWAFVPYEPEDREQYLEPRLEQAGSLSTGETLESFYRQWPAAWLGTVALVLVVVLFVLDETGVVPL